MFCSSQDGKGLAAAALRTAGTGFTFPGRSLLSRCPEEALPHPPTPSSHPSPASRSLPSAAGASLCLPPSLSKPDPVPWIYPLAFLLSRFGVASRPRSDKRSRHPQVTAGARPSPGCNIFLLAVVTILGGSRADPNGPEVSPSPPVLAREIWQGKLRWGGAGAEV